MNVLLIGGSCSLIDNLILKIRKEGHRVFLLTGDKYKQSKYQKVFERYDFPYDCEELREILESVNPDVTIFMGAFDTNYRWNNEERESVKYTSNLINILVAYSEVRRGKFIMLSSHEVYSGNHTHDIEETESTLGSGFKGATLAQAEEICANFHKNWNLDIVVLRLDHVYSIPKELKDVNNICARMCIQSLKDGCIKVDSKNEFSLLPERDAVEFIFQVVKINQHSQFIYHLSSGRVISEVELAGMIEKYLQNGSSIVTVDESGGRCVLSGKKFEEEYGIHAFGKLEENVEKMAAYMKKHASVFVDERELSLSWWKRMLNQWMWLAKAIIPFIENLICFIPFFMLNNRTVGSEYFANLDPYLLYVLLFAIVYGQQQATFSAICAVAGYMFRQMYNRTGFDVILDYNTYVWIAQLFILGLVVGYMRDQIRAIRAESKELEAHLSQQIVNIKDINGSNVRVKEVLEQQLIDHKDSIGKIYSITSRLDQQMPEEVMFDAVEMMTELMHTKDVAIYNVVNDDYARMFSASSEKARSLGNSIRYREMQAVYDELKEQKVYINKSLDEKYPLMANAIFEGGKMQMIIMIWGLNWEKMTLGQANFLTVVSYLIQNAVLRARRYMTALEEKRYLKDTHVMEVTAFQSLVNSYMNAKKRNLVECTFLKIQNSENRYEEIGKVMTRQLRTSDYLGFMPDKEVYVLLANTSPQDAVFVQNRFDQNGYVTKVVENMAE